MKKSIDNYFIKKYKVDDIIPNDKEKIKYVFLLESPAKTEVQLKIPVCGKTGMNLSKSFEINNYTFGILLKNFDVRSIAVINACQYPLGNIEENQFKSDNARELSKYLKRNSKSINHNNEDADKMLQLITDSLEKRLNELPNNAIIIPCGHFARKVFKKCNIFRFSHVTKKTPHPSRKPLTDADLDNHKSRIKSLLDSEINI